MVISSFDRENLSGQFNEMSAKEFFDSADIQPSVISAMGRIYTSATLKKTQLFLVGDSSHIDRKQHIARMGLLSSILQDGDVVLLEGGKSLQEVDYKKHAKLQLLNLKNKNITVMGWDDIDLVKESLKITGKIISLRKLGKEIFQKPKPSKSILKKIKKDINDLKEKKLQFALGKRNESLYNTVRECQKKFKQRIFVISGQGHFIPELINRFEDDRATFIKFKITHGFKNTSVKQREYYEKKIPKE
jgi:hypothetical protein